MFDEPQGQGVDLGKTILIVLEDPTESLRF